MEEVDKERYKSTYLNHSVKTNVTLDDFIYEKYHNRSLETLGNKLRDLFNVSSLEYEDYNFQENSTDDNYETHDETNMEELTTNPYVPEHSANVTEHEHKPRINISPQDENCTKLLNEELKQEREDVSTNIQFSFTTTVHNLQKSEANESSHSEESIRRIIKPQQYNVDLAEKYMKELQDLEAYVDIVHDKVNKTHTRFTELSDRIDSNICKFAFLSGNIL